MTALHILMHCAKSSLYGQMHCALHAWRGSPCHITFPRVPSDPGRIAQYLICLHQCHCGVYGLNAIFLVLPSKLQYFLRSTGSCLRWGLFTAICIPCIYSSIVFIAVLEMVTQGNSHLIWKWWFYSQIFSIKINITSICTLIILIFFQNLHL